MDWDFHCAAERAEAEEVRVAKTKTAELNFMMNGCRNLDIQNTQYQVSVVKWTKASLFGVAVVKLKAKLNPLSKTKAADSHNLYLLPNPSRPKNHNLHINNTAVGTRSRSPLHFRILQPIKNPHHDQYLRPISHVTKGRSEARPRPYYSKFQTNAFISPRDWRIPSFHS